MFCKANGFLKILTELVFWLVEDFLLYPCYSLVDRRLNIFCFFLIGLENLLAGLLVNKGELQSGSAILMFEERGPSFHALGCSTFSTQSLREHVCSIWKAPAAPHWHYSVFCLFFFFYNIGKSALGFFLDWESQLGECQYLLLTWLFTEL